MGEVPLTVSSSCNGLSREEMNEWERSRTSKVWVVSTFCSILAKPFPYTQQILAAFLKGAVVCPPHRLRKGKIKGCINSFSLYCGKITNKKNSRKKVSLLSPHSGTRSLLTRKAYCQLGRTGKHSVCSQEAEEGEFWYSACFLPIFHSRALAHALVPPTFKVGLVYSV